MLYGSTNHMQACMIGPFDFSINLKKLKEFYKLCRIFKISGLNIQYVKFKLKFCKNSDKIKHSKEILENV